jgi:hypothetical protein
VVFLDLEDAVAPDEKEQACRMKSRHCVPITAIAAGLAAGDVSGAVFGRYRGAVVSQRTGVRYGGGVKQSYHPALLLALLFYGYAAGMFYSRKLEQAIYDSVTFRFIRGGTLLQTMTR